MGGARVRTARWRARGRVVAAALVVALLAVATPVGAVPAPVAAATAPVFPADAADMDGLRAAKRRWPADAVPGRLLVTSAAAASAATLRAAVMRGEEPALAAAAAGAGPRPTTRALAARVTRLDVPPGTEAASAAGLRARPGVVAVEPVRTRRPTAVPDDRVYAQQWAHQQTGIEAAWDRTTGDPARTVAILDTGIVGFHPELVGAVTEQVSAASGAVLPVGVGVDNDPCGDGHGTQVAGVVGAAGDNGVGVAGVNWRVSILDVSLSGPETGCLIPDDAILAGIRYAADRGVDVINLSLGGPQDYCPAAFEQVIAEARAAGAVIVAAAGNEELRPGLEGAPQVPASCNGVVSVGATGLDGTLAPYSTTNPHVDLVAPGGDSEGDGLVGAIVTTTADGGVGTTEGTSFAAPYVAGLVPLLRTLRPDLTPSQVESVLERTAAEAGAAGRDDAYGWGLVHAGEAAALADAGEPVPAPEPDPVFPAGADGGQFDTPPVADEVLRVAGGTGDTEPVGQAVAVSAAVFPDDGAAHVVLARSDDYADALAGSALGFGVGPLLFTGAAGGLEPRTAAEVQRVLPAGGTVYLLGGSEALPEGLGGELRALGHEPVRLAGGGREETAVIVAEELRYRIRQLGTEPLPAAIVATSGAWPDAVAAGSMASWFGLPVYLTGPEDLHPLTRDALRLSPPQLVYVVGGEDAVSAEAYDEIVATVQLPPSQVVRLGGPERNTTAVEVAREVEALLGEVNGAPPTVAVATNVRRSDGYAHVLSASAITGRYSGVFVPVDGQGGDDLTLPAEEYVTGFGVTGVVAGDVDVVSERSAARLAELLQG